MCHSEPGPWVRPVETSRFVLITACAALIWVSAVPRPAEACGCLSPPIPAPEEVDFAVNQESELIIFEVEQGDDPHVTAHVLIKYAGDPEKFGWLIPVPSVPELSLSHSGAFGLIEEQTRPAINITPRNVCPQQQWTCRTHPPPSCTSSSDGRGYSAGGGAQYDDYNAAGDSGGFGAGTGGAGSAPPPPVTVYARESVGDYETVTIGAGDGEAAVQWLNDQGFIVNSTMGKYMQPYLDAGMLFLASKLQPNADVSELRPLRMRYAGDTPAIPLQLTAVAAEPHLTVTAIIYADGPYEPYGHPIVEVGEDDIGSPDGSANNYAAVLSRLADSVGGDGFVLEYYGTPPAYADPNPQCCGAQGGVTDDICGVSGNGVCECPLRDYDAVDCGGESGPAAEIGMVAELASKYTRVTRLSTRLSPEEMSFDPMFRPMLSDDVEMGRRTFTGTHTVLTGCSADVVNGPAYDQVVSTQECASTYCGVEGQCVGTAAGAGCVCSRQELARVFTDLDGTRAVTCVPQQGTVDLSAGGLELPDACAGKELSAGSSCFDIGGFATVLCPAGQAAVSTGADVAACEPVVAETDGPGGRNYTLGVDALEVCAPAPPACPRHGWLEPVAVQIEGSQCLSSVPDASWLEVPPMPTCGAYYPTPMDTAAPRAQEDDVSLCGCRAVGSQPVGSPAGGLAALLVMLGAALRLRRGQG